MALKHQWIINFKSSQEKKKINCNYSNEKISLRTISEKSEKTELTTAYNFNRKTQDFLKMKIKIM